MQCQALSLADGQRCTKEAEDNPGLFCIFHSRQCYGLYAGYKRRNLELDHLIERPPPILQGKQLHTLDLSSVDDEKLLQELYDHLFQRYVLLDRVIRARRLHHSRFYSIELDYGHEQFINQLSASRTPLMRALEDVSHRVAEVRYDQQKWFSWIQNLEMEEEKQRDTEKKKIKQEAALFQRHAKELEKQRQILQSKHEQKRQQEYLDKVWTEQNSTAAKALSEESEDQEAWDPIEDTIEDERELYLNLLRFFLWKTDPTQEEQKVENSLRLTVNTIRAEQDQPSPIPNVPSTKSKNARKKAKQKANANDAQDSPAPPKTVPEKRHVESLEQMRHRLRHPEQYKGTHLVSINTETFQQEIHRQLFSLGEDEVEKVLLEIQEIKQFLFCRLLLSRASILPAALKAQSIDDFLSGDKISNIELRDLCLRLEQPSLQEIRDACADYKRHEDEIEDESDVEEEPKKQSKGHSLSLRRAIPARMQTKYEKSIKKRRAVPAPDLGGAIVDFGHIDDEGKFRTKRMSIKVCGKNIYNYPSEKAMSREGWFQFSIMAKDCTADDAVKLCRSWDEFYELATLIRYNYFPSTLWMNFVGEHTNEQLMTLTFMSYFQVEAADMLDHKHQTPRSAGLRRHSGIESRNFICGVMKRNDPVTRRFIQYVAMRSSTMVMMVRDVSTGEVLVQPPDEELWLIRSKSGMGRFSRGEWTIKESVGPEFLERVDVLKRWSLGFKDFYDIVIWDYRSGSNFAELYSEIEACLFKALRYRQAADVHKPSQHILESIVWDPEEMRSRDARIGEETLWKQLTRSGKKLVLLKKGQTGIEAMDEMGEELEYNEADRLEDEVLFPGEQSKSTTTDTSEKSDDQLLAGYGKALHKFENSAPDIRRFALELDTDEELSDDDMQINLGRRDQNADGYSTDDSDSGEHDSELIDDGDDIDELDDIIPENLDTESEALAQEACQILFAWMAGDDMEVPVDNASMNKIPSSRQEKKLRVASKKLQEQQLADDFELFVDRSRAAAFKECWHGADLETNAQHGWAEFKALFNTWTTWRRSNVSPLGRYGRMKQAGKLLTAMEVDPNAHHRVLRDMWEACDITDLMFNRTESFLETDTGKPFKGSLLFDKERRAAQLPDRRTPHSCQLRPDNHWKAWDEANKGNRHSWLADRYPKDWDVILRPIIAFLYREGVICTGYDLGTAGQAVCLTEPTRPTKPDLFFDFRATIGDIHMLSTMQNPSLITPLPEQAKSYAEKHAGAKFSVLKIWSAPHFWPLMIGYNNRENTSFMDGLGRIWHWKFVPKDMPFSEWSIHRTMQMRLEAFEHFFANDTRMNGGEVTLRKDMVLVKAKDEEMCRFLTTAVVYAIQTRPWRLEVDPWKSWFNVDVGFIESLSSEWWD